MSPFLALPLALLAAGPPVDKPTFLSQEGTEHYRLGLYKQAIGEFLDADRLRPSPALAYDVAQTYERLDDPEHAALYYRLYLERAPGASDRQIVEHTLRNLDAWSGARRAANEDPGGNFRKLGFLTLAASAGVAAAGLGSQVAGDAEGSGRTPNTGLANALHITADGLFVTAGVGFLSAGLFFLLGTTSYAVHQSQVAVRPTPSGLAFTW